MSNHKDTDYKTREELANENIELQTRLEEAEDTLSAIQNGEIDAIVGRDPENSKIYTLEGADHLYRGLIQEMSEGLATLTSDGTIFYSNIQLASMLQTPLEQISGSKLSDFVLPDDLGIYNEIFSSGLEGNGTGEINIRSVDGTVIPVMISVRTLKGLGLYAIITDLSEHKHHEQLKTLQKELKESETKYRSIFDNSMDAILFTKPDGTILDANYAAERLFGYSREKICELGRSNPMDNNKKKLSEFLEEMENTNSTQGELELSTNDGSKFIAEISFAIFTDSEGITRTSMIIRDVTNKKKVEEQLERSNSELEHFAYVASHDLREPLRMITNFLQLLERRYYDQLDAEANEFIYFAVDGAKRLNHMINDLLKYSRVTSQEINFTHVNCEKVLEKTIINLKVQIEENDAIITHDPLPIIMGDENLMVQLFQNLVGNAIKYHGNEIPHVHISSIKENKQFLFSIKDNGIGIKSEHLKRIFTIFQRLHQRDEYDGTGIGLSITQKIVEQHGGMIWVESEYGKGSTFYFTIPDSIHQRQFIDKLK